MDEHELLEFDAYIMFNGSGFMNFVLSSKSEAIRQVSYRQEDVKYLAVDSPMIPMEMDDGEHNFLKEMFFEREKGYDDNSARED